MFFVDSYLEYRICENILWAWYLPTFCAMKLDDKSKNILYQLFQIFEDLDKYLKNLDSYEHVPINDISVV